jgi:type IV pilus assembly protein PilW
MTRAKPSQRGHTLLELSVAVALGLLVVIATVALYRGQRQAFQRSTETARLHDAAMNALDLLAQQVQMAGFLSAGNMATDNPPALFGCSKARPIGADDAPTCETLASRSDGIIVRYFADIVSTWPSSAGSPTDCLGQVTTGATITNRFYAKVSSSTVEPELYCEGSGKPGTGQPMVEGIERIKIDYWFNGASSAVDAAAISRDRWPLVTGVDMCVLARADSVDVKARPRYVDCDGSTVVSTDGRVRQAFWRKMALRNAGNGGSS